jgi:hypothetical protein
MRKKQVKRVERAIVRLQEYRAKHGKPQEKESCKALFALRQARKA